MKHNIIRQHKVTANNKLIFGIDDLAFATLGSSVVGGLLGSVGQSNANKANERINERNLEWQEQMWNKSNEYNTPKAQRDRLLKAGLNPLSFSGMGQTPAQTVGTPQQLPMQNSMAALGQGVSQGTMAAAQIENVRAQTDKVRQEALVTEQQKEQLQILNGIARKTADSEGKATIMENLVKYNRAWAECQAYTECPDALKNALLDTWQDMSQKYVNDFLEYQIRSVYQDKIQPKELEAIEQSIAASRAQVENIPIQNALTKRQQDIQARGQDQQYALGQAQIAAQKWMKTLDVTIAKIGAAAGVEQAHIAAGLSKEMGELLTPLIGLGKKGVEKFVKNVERYGFEKAFNIAIGRDKGGDKPLGGASVGAW